MALSATALRDLLDTTAATILGVAYTGSGLQAAIKGGLWTVIGTAVASWLSGEGVGAPVYGGMDEDTIGAGHTTITCTVQGTWYPWITASAESLSDGVTYTNDNTNGDYIAVSKKGVYMCTAEANYAASPTQTFQVGVFVNASATPAFKFEAVAQGTPESGMDNGFLDLAANDKIRIKVKCTSGAGKTFTIHHLECLLWQLAWT